ncbi:MAG TPA: hypothetical protein VM847_21145, partial [Tahibacter sp.]|nr:hypothetical protein [Tahibacter sp.]
HGEDRVGWPDYRQRMDRFMREADRISQGMHLQNGLAMMRAIASLVGLIAVADEIGTGAAKADERSGMAPTA